MAGGRHGEEQPPAEKDGHPALFLPGSDQALIASPTGTIASRTSVSIFGLNEHGHGLLAYVAELISRICTTVSGLMDRTKSAASPPMAGRHRPRHLRTVSRVRTSST